jgi:nucleoside-diphosphate-sugar epimerase
MVTGATGFLGAEVVRLLLERDKYTVIALTQNPEKLEQLISWCHCDRIQGLVGDIRSLSQLPQPVDIIVHAAAMRSPRCEQEPAQCIDVNIAGTANLLQLAMTAGTQGFVFISSQSVYGNQSPPWHEAMTPAPHKPYAISKYGGECLVRRFTTALATTVVRLSRLYGVNPFMRSSDLPRKFARLTVCGAPLPVHSDGSQRLDLLHVRDAARCIVQIVEVYPSGWNGIYNVGSGRSVTVNEIVATLDASARQLGLSPVIVERFLELAARGQHWELDTRRVQEVFGWEPQVSLHDGLSEHLRAAAAVGRAK